MTRFEQQLNGVLPTAWLIRAHTLKIQWLIALLRHEQKGSVTEKGRELSERIQELIRQRSQLRTAADVERIEREQGLLQ